MDQENDGFHIWQWIFAFFLLFISVDWDYFHLHIFSACKRFPLGELSLQTDLILDNVHNTKWEYRISISCPYYTLVWILGKLSDDEDQQLNTSEYYER